MAPLGKKFKIMNQKYIKILLVVLVVAIVVPQVALAAWWNPFSWGIWHEIASWFQPQQQEQVACTMDAMECPDGSFVGRVAPSCEFAECPASTLIKLISPNGGEIWEVGKTYEIKWTVPAKPQIGFDGKPIDKINIDL
jgi:hypothetical protein